MRQRSGGEIDVMIFRRARSLLLLHPARTRGRYDRLMKRLLIFAVAVLACAAVACAQPFVTARDVDLVKFLPLPPADDSAQARAEMAEVLSVQAARTPEMTARAQSDSDETVWRFAEIFGTKFT